MHDSPLVEYRWLHGENQRLVSGTKHTELGPHNTKAQSWSGLQLQQSCSRACSQMALLCTAAERSLLYLCSPGPGVQSWRACAQPN